MDIIFATGNQGKLDEIREIMKDFLIKHDINLISLKDAGIDIEIVEAHHNQKIDSPSGTALMIADSINGVKDDSMKYEFDRHSKRAKRTQNEIGIHSVRGGTIVGEHEIIFAGDDEVIKISHSAASKQIFATGSINAAMFLTKCKPGLYSMKDMIK